MAGVLEAEKCTLCDHGIDGHKLDASGNNISYVCQVPGCLCVKEVVL